MLCQPFCDIYSMSLSWHQHLYYNGRLYKDGKEVAMSKQQANQIFKWAIRDSELKHETRPFFLFNGSHNITFPQLHNVADNSVFYFFEPLTYYSHNRIGHRDHILRTDDCKGVRAYELDSVAEFVYQHGITDHTVYLPDLNSATHLTTEYTLNFDYYDPYLAAEATRLNTFGRYLPHWYYTNKIKKALWCGSWRYDPVRHYIVAGLVNNDVHLNNNFSWFYNIEKDDVDNVMWADVPDNVIAGIDKLNTIGPLIIDTPDVQLVNYKNFYPEVDQASKDPAKHYQECFCALIIETRVVQPWVNTSEKTLHAIKNRRPFLLYAAPGSLQSLRNAGIKTFGDYWDESYDTIVDSAERIHAVSAVAEQINNMPIAELKLMYSDMKELLLHNISTVKNIQCLAKY